MKYKKALIISTVLIIGFLGFYGVKALVVQNQQNFTENEKILTVDDYDKKDATLARLGFESVDSLKELSDGTEVQDKQVETLQNVFEMLDTVERENDMVDATLSIALYLNLLGQTDKAIDQYKYLLINRPTHSTVMNNLAWIYIDRGEYKKAEEYFKTNIKNNPEFSSWYVNLADLYCSYMPDKKVEVPELIKGGIENKLEDFPLTIYLAEFYENEKEYEKALEWYNKALEINPNAEYAKQAIEFIQNKVSK